MKKQKEKNDDEPTYVSNNHCMEHDLMNLSQDAFKYHMMSIRHKPKFDYNL